MTPAIEERFAKVRALMDSDNAGEAAAAKARYDAMVAKYGDPDMGKSSFLLDEEELAAKWNVRAAHQRASVAAAMQRAAEAAFKQAQRAEAVRAASYLVITWDLQLTEFGPAWLLSIDGDANVMSDVEVIDMARVRGWEDPAL